MEFKYPEHRKRFIKALRSADIPAGRASSDVIAEALECSESHVRNLFLGNKRYCGRTKAKLDALIAAKGNADYAEHVVEAMRPLTEPAPLSPLNKAEPDPVVEHVLKRAEPDLRSEPQLEKRYRVVGRDVRVEQFTSTRVATFESPVAAAEYADWLNDQINRGKEAG